MSKLIVYQMTKEEVYQLLNGTRLLDEVAEYLCLKKNGHSHNAYEFKDAARELIYQKCAQSFQYNDYVNDAKAALDRVRYGSFGKWISWAIKEEKNEIAWKKDKQERSEKIATLKEECRKNGLDFRKEKKKLLKELKEERKKNSEYKYWKEEHKTPRRIKYRRILLIFAPLALILLYTSIFLKLPSLSEIATILFIPVFVAVKKLFFPSYD